MFNTDVSEQVVLLSDSGKPIGQMAKSDVHTFNTPLHLAFSCLIYRNTFEILMTRRALTKRTWPGVWTGSCCGHPNPRERIEESIHRRVAFELGTTVADLRCVISDFRYRAVSAEGLVENEICPVYFGRLNAPLTPNIAEVAEYKWMSLANLQTVAKLAPFVLSPWLVGQLSQLPDNFRRQADLG